MNYIKLTGFVICFIFFACKGNDDKENIQKEDSFLKDTIVEQNETETIK